MMGNEFEEFLNFVYERTGRYPEKLADSFRDIFIYIPNGKTPPNTNVSFIPKRTICMRSYFSNRNKDFCELVYNKDWNELEDHLGSDLLRFCLTECIFAKRTKAGSFMVSNLSNFRKKILADPPQRLNKIFYQTATFCKESPKGSSNNPALVLNNDMTESRDDLQDNLNYLFCPHDIEISTDCMLFKISRNSKFPDGHILVEENTRMTMSYQVITTRVGNWKIVDYQDCIEPLELILKRLKKLHNTYNYDKALSQLLIPRTEGDGDEGRGNHQKIDNQLPIPVLKMYFTNICRCVIPTELFGSNKNLNTVIKIICNLLETPRNQTISLIPYIQKMRILDICWLNGVKNIDTQLSIMGKLLKWLFNKFILEIFRTQLYIMVTNSYQKIYFKQEDWQKLTAKFLHKMFKDKIIVNTNGVNTKVSCDGRWTLFPKENGMRPIMSRIRGSKPGEITKTALCYLQQLYRSKYGESVKQIFLEKWRTLVDKFRNYENKPMYLVCCDIQYAYESIDQRKLVEIVESLTDSTEPELRLRYYQIARDLRAVKKNCFRLKKCVEYPELELPIASKSIFACGSDKVVRISKEALLREIKQNVLNQNILILNQKCLLQKGIAQGAILSSVLCDMYYAHMEEANLSQFKDEGFLYRYVDDFLFATEDKALAERFLQHVNEGFPEYNCSFSPAKTCTNLPGHPNYSEDITYLGFKINSDTLEVTPAYSKSPRYTTALSKPRYRIMETFCKRLLNLASLKLDGILLDCRINSEDTVIDNIKCIFVRQAERCLWLLKALFDDIPSQLSQIFKIIKSTNLQIIKRIHRYFIANGYDFQKLVPRLAVLPWKCYRQVFGKMPAVHTHFRSLFFKNIHDYFYFLYIHALRSHRIVDYYAGMFNDNKSQELLLRNKLSLNRTLNFTFSSIGRTYKVYLVRIVYDS